MGCQWAPGIAKLVHIATPNEGYWRYDSHRPPRAVPKTMLFFKQIELFFQEKVDFSSENAHFEKFQKHWFQHKSTMTNKS